MSTGSHISIVSKSSQWQLPIKIVFCIPAFSKCASLHFVKKKIFLRITHHKYADAVNGYLSTVDLKGVSSELWVLLLKQSSMAWYL